MNRIEKRASLQGIFPGPSAFFPFLLAMNVILCLSVSGVHGRVVDLCKPIQRKYETTVSVVLGRNIDATRLRASTARSICGY